MMTLAINAIGTAIAWFNQIEIRAQKSLNDLPCKVTEINETQDYALPTFALENGEYGSDTIYRMPLKVTARLFVQGYEYTDFESMLKDIQFSEDFIEIKAMNGKKYKNLKIQSWARDTTSQMVGATYYNVEMQEFIIVDSLSATLAKAKGGLSSAKDTGNKAPHKTNQSVLFKGGKWTGIIK